ncbi:MAG: type II toxin-antitoxin system RelE/ParE family toxin [Deltaproteobacteria bacterium]|jgi:mRNA interferase RelE/StbE|nr:type II toxin-antitoxin system RelE/ParE family toxin [Deltaproteobacteria bacterium]
MNWKIIYHHDVTGDLESLGRAEAARVMRVIDERIRQGEPDKIGKPLHGSLGGYRRLRTGHIRIVYRVNMDMIEVIVVAVGMRRGLEVYSKAERRTKYIRVMKR